VTLLKVKRIRDDLGRKSSKRRKMPEVRRNPPPPNRTPPPNPELLELSRSSDPRKSRRPLPRAPEEIPRAPREGEDLSEYRRSLGRVPYRKRIFRFPISILRSRTKGYLRDEPGTEFVPPINGAKLNFNSKPDAIVGCPTRCMRSLGIRGNIPSEFLGEKLSEFRRVDRRSAEFAYAFSLNVIGISELAFTRELLRPSKWDPFLRRAPGMLWVLKGNKMLPLALCRELVSLSIRMPSYVWTIGGDPATGMSRKAGPRFYNIVETLRLLMQSRRELKINPLLDYIERPWDILRSKIWSYGQSERVA
jgi:hypothetical protein